MPQNSKFAVELLTNSIIQIKIFPGTDIDAEDASEMRKVVLQLADGGKYAIFLDATEMFNISDDARKLIASIENGSQRIAIGVYIKSLANKLIGNFFIKVNKPNSPTKLFSTRESALEWLNQEVERSK